MTISLAAIVFNFSQRLAYKRERSTQHSMQSRSQNSMPRARPRLNEIKHEYRMPPVTEHSNLELANQQVDDDVRKDLVHPTCICPSQRGTVRCT